MPSRETIPTPITPEEFNKQRGPGHGSHVMTIHEIASPHAGTDTIADNTYNRAIRLAQDVLKTSFGGRTLVDVMTLENAPDVLPSNVVAEHELWAQPPFESDKQATAAAALIGYKFSTIKRGEIYTPDIAGPCITATNLESRIIIV